MGVSINVCHIIKKRISGPAKLGGAANRPEVRKDVSGLRKGDLNGLRMGKVANIV